MTGSLTRAPSNDHLLSDIELRPAGAADTATSSATAIAEPAPVGKTAKVKMASAEPVFNSHPSFPLAIETLQELTDNRDDDLLAKLGGVEGLAKHLRTDLETGLAGDEAGVPGDDRLESGGNQELAAVHDLLPEGHELASFKARRHAYGTNFLPPSPPPSLLALMWEALEDLMLRILLVAAIVSIGIGMYMKYSGGDPYEWIEGVAILGTVAFVVMVNAVNDYKKALQFRFLSSQRGLTSVITVTRRVHSGAEPAQATIPVIHLMVGDIVHLATGDLVPADGVFLSGHNCKADESTVTGETDAVSKKLTGDRYLISGSKIIEGICTYVVTSVGQHSLQGRSMIALRSGESEFTPLQVKLNDLAGTIANFGIAAAGLIVVISLIKFFILYGKSGFTLDPNGNPTDGSKIAERIIKIFITGVTVIVVSVPEGLPMAVTLSLGYATIRMLKDNNLVRVLSSCETMGGATTICSDKTGTLTQNKMTVVQGSFFNGGVVFETQEQLRPRLMAPEIPAAARQVLTQSVNINSTAYEGVDEAGLKILVGSKTECALLEFSSLLSTSFNLDRQAAVQLGVIPFSSDRKRMSTVIAKAQSNSAEISFNAHLPAAESAPAAPVTGDARLFAKGASELILASCDYMVDEHGHVVPLTADRRDWFNGQILAYATNALRTIGVAYKDIRAPAAGEELAHDLDMAGLIWIGVAGIEDPLRPEVPPAVERCQKAGIVVRMVTGDNGVTAKNIAKRCGILRDESREVVMEGPQFRVLSDAEMKKLLPRLRVLARSSPLDKRILVNKLKELGETVAVTGDGTNDAPALKAADVGFAMGIAGTEVAKEASDIILMDDNFASLAKAVMWGRSVYDAVRKFLQFQLSVNVTAVGLAMITAAVDPNSEAVITAVQLLWVNLIMDTLAALALATDPPSETLLDRMPHKKSDPLISYDMWKMIFGQSLYQVVTTTILAYLSGSLFGFDDHIDHKHKSAIVFNAFVWMQLFNLFNGRMIHGEINVFKGMTKNNMFMGIILFIAVLQVLIIEFGSIVFGVVPLTAVEWIITLALGLVSLPLAVVIKVLPDVGRSWFEDKFYAKENDPVEVASIEAAAATPAGERATGLAATVDGHRAREQWADAIRKTQLQNRVVAAFRASAGRDRMGVVVLE
ncbi:plasma membrane calcium [Blastocladiella emersonii ATCC 22665]|nr:plasma membrane calcium [Blastocladiella emersonii ATCC 22665]